MIPMTRRRAFLTHLAISALIVGALVACFVLFLFPMPFFVENGGWQGIRIIAAVDATIGPLLTLIIYNPKKSRGKLLFDLVTIGLIQLSALGAGMWITYAARTEAVLFVDGNFYSIDTQTGSSLGPEYAALLEKSPGRPFYGYIDLPDAPEPRQKMRLLALKSNSPLFRMVDLLRPLSVEAKNDFEATDRKIGKLAADDATRGKIEEWAARRGAGVDDYYFVPTYCTYGTILLALSKRDMTVAGNIRGVSLKP